MPHPRHSAPDAIPTRPFDAPCRVSQDDASVTCLWRRYDDDGEGSGFGSRVVGAINSTAAAARAARIQRRARTEPAVVRVELGAPSAGSSRPANPYMDSSLDDSAILKRSAAAGAAAAARFNAEE